MEKRCTADVRSDNCRGILMKLIIVFHFCFSCFVGFFPFSPHCVDDSLLSASVKLISQKKSHNIHFYLFRLFIYFYQ